jgi:hypothetical protein
MSSRLERADHGTQSRTSREIEQVQEVGELQAVFIVIGRRELLGGRSRIEILPQRDEGGAQLLDRRLVHLREPDLEHDLLVVRHTLFRDAQQIDDLRFRRRGLRDLSRPHDHVLVGHLAGQHDRFVGHADRDAVARKQRPHLPLQRSGGRLDDDVELATIGLAPDDEADGPGGFAVDQDFARDDDHGVSDCRVGHGYPDDVESRRQHDRASCHEGQRFEWTRA